MYLHSGSATRLLASNVRMRCVIIQFSYSSLNDWEFILYYIAPLTIMYYFIQSRTLSVRIDLFTRTTRLTLRRTRSWRSWTSESRVRIVLYCIVLYSIALTHSHRPDGGNQREGLGRQSRRSAGMKQYKVAYCILKAKWYLILCCMTITHLT